MALPRKLSSSKVVFLDIDGVLQGWEQNRFEHLEDGSFDRVIKDASKRFAYIDESFDYMFAHSAFVYDLLAAVYDWDKQAVCLLKRLLEETNAGIVVSSNWRRMSANALTLFLSLHDIENRLSGATILDHNHYHPDRDAILRELSTPSYCQFFEEIEQALQSLLDVNFLDSRAMEIYIYLLVHPEIESFVVIDDLKMSEYFPQNAVQTVGLFSEDDFFKAKTILTKSSDLSLLDKLPAHFREKAKMAQEISDQVFW